LKTPDEIVKDAEAVLFVDWIDQLRMFMEDTGQDGVFHLTKDSKEVNLLVDFGSLDVEETTTAVQAIKTENCVYDINNLKTSGIAVRASLSTSMLQRIKGMVPVSASGPETLAAVIAAHQVLDTSGCRILVEELRKLKLREFPAENVDEFRLKVLEKGRRIEGCLQPPPDLAALITACFRGTQSVDFNMEVAEWYKKATRRRVTDWREIISELTITYKTLVNNGEWPAATNRKEDVAKTIQGLFSKMENKLDSKIENKIQNKLQQGNGGRNRSNGGGNQTETRTCHHCGKAGHIKPNCPELKPAGSSNGGGGSTAPTTTTPSSLPGKKRYEAPADNESHTKKLGNDTGNGALNVSAGTKETRLISPMSIEPKTPPIESPRVQSQQWPAVLQLPALEAGFSDSRCQDGLQKPSIVTMFHGVLLAIAGFLLLNPTVIHPMTIFPH
jgi:hypothetical protein